MQHVWRQIIVLLVSVSFICTGIMMLGSHSVKAQDDYTFGTELANKGTSTNPTERNTENAVYNTLKEADQYPDTTYYSGSTESMTYGTTGGGAFPSALDTDDATRRNYIEANINPASYTNFLDPTSDAQAQWDVVFPASPTTHFDKLDDAGTADLGDQDTTYVDTSTVTDVDIFGMSDMTTPGAGYSLTVTIYLVHKKVGGSQSANIQAGIRIGTTNYQGISVNPTRDVYVNGSSSAWATNPAGGAWTYTDVNALQTYIATSDISPVPYATKLVLKIVVTYPTADYEMQGTLTYSNVLSTAQTTGYTVLCQGYRSGSENFYVQAWDYTTTAWVTKVTINSASDTEFDFTLTGWDTNHERSSGNEVKFRLIDVTGSDTAQDTLFLDLLKIQRIEVGYALDVELSATAVAQYGNIALRIKGYTSGEQFNVNVWNYTSSAYDVNKLSITSLSNTWQTTLDLCDGHHRSGTTVKIQFVDGTPSTSDLVQDTLYLDVCWVTRYHTDPTITSYGRSPANPNVGDTITWWMTYTDYDNEAPSTNYPKVHIDSTDYSMTENGTDTAYWDGKLYHFTKDDLAGGDHTFYFITKDANSNEVSTTSVPFKVNRNPTLTTDGVTPATGNNGQEFSFYVTYTDADGDPPSYVKVNIATVDYVMVANGTGTYLTGAPYHYEKAMSGGTHAYYFKTKDANGTEVSTTPKNLIVNNIPVLSNPQRTPADPIYVTTEIIFRVTYTDADGDLPTAIKWREGTGTIQNLTMTEVDPGDTDVTNGKVYEKVLYLSHGNHDYDFYATDGKVHSHVMGQGGSLVVQNRAPTIDNKFVDDHEWRNTYWEYDYAYTDLDGDTVVFQMSTNASFLNINAASGLVYGTTSNPVGWYSGTVWCNDSYSGSDSDSFILYTDNREPIITNGPNSHVDQWRNQAWHYDFDFSDADGDSMSWARSGPSWLTIASDGNLSGTTSDTPGLYSFTVYANDSYGGSDTYVFDIHIENRAPEITNGPGSHVDEWRNTAWQYDFDYSDADGDSMSWGISGVTWLSISGTGLLSGTTTDIPGEYGITVYANDSYSGQDTYPFTLHISNRAPMITSAGNTTQLVTTYMAYYVTATDGDSDSLSIEFWSEAGWLSLDNWWVNGTATGVGFYQCKVWVNDSYDSDIEEWQVEVTSLGNQPPSFTSAPIDEVDHPVDYYYDANASDPEEDLLTFDIESSCPYLDINPSTGVVSGNIPIAGTWDLNISVTDGEFVVWQNFSLTATNDAPSFTSNPTESWQHGTNYVYDANASDGNGDSLVFGLAGNCTEFLTITSSTGMISGAIPTVGWWYLNVSVTDSYSTIWQNQTLTGLNTVPSITSSGITDWPHGTMYYYDANASDVNSDVLSWYLEGNCTTYLQINATTGIVNGTVPIMGWWFVNIRVTDSWATIWQNFTLYTHNAAPYFTTNPILMGTNGTAYYYNANANDNNSDTVTFALIGSPGWLFVDDVTGEVEGTCTLLGEYSVHLRIFDGLTYEWQNWTLTISEPAPPAPPNPPASDMSGFTFLIMLGAIGLGAFVIIGKITNRGKQAKKPKEQEKKHGR